MSDYELDPSEERALFKYAEGYESHPSSPAVTPKKQYVPPSLLGRRRRPRAPREARAPRKNPRVVGEFHWDSDLSETENVLSARKRTLANRRRRNAYISRPRRVPDRRWQPPPPGGRPVVLEPIDTDDTQSDAGSRHHPEILSRKAKTERKRRMRRDGREVTPDWIEVPSDEEYRYAKFSCFQDDRKFTLAEYLLPKYRAASTSRVVCGICPDSHNREDCPFALSKKGKDVVDMGQLFSFMR